MNICAPYRKVNNGEGIDWNYITKAKCHYVLDLPHSCIRDKSYSNKWFSIEPIRSPYDREQILLSIEPAYVWDGASKVPDWDGGVILASLPHDVLYQFVEELAKALGMTIKEVLSFANVVFKLVMEYFKTPKIIIWTYYKGVCWFGYAYNRYNAKKKE